jgi:hypothetical protein
MTAKIRTRKPTQAEIDGDVFEAVRLSPAEDLASRIQLTEHRRSRPDLSENSRLALDLLHLKLTLEQYLLFKPFDPNKSFGFFLKEYVTRINIKRKTFAADISINETLLSQFINKHRLPPDYIPIRLEIHSNNKIPAAYWYKLVEKEREHLLLTDKTLRKKQRKFVKNIIQA